jgi:hypothetical protein
LRRRYSSNKQQQALFKLQKEELLYFDVNEGRRYDDELDGLVKRGAEPRSYKGSVRPGKEIK